MAEQPKKEPTAAEAMLFFSIVKHTRNKADVDWEAVATEAGFKNAEVAKVRFGQVKRKLGISTETTSTTRATPRKAASSTASPSKVVKTPRSGGGRSKAKAKAKDSITVKKEEEMDEKEDALDMPSPGEYGNVKAEEEANNQLHDELNTSFKFDQPNPFAGPTF